MVSNKTNIADSEDERSILKNLWDDLLKITGTFQVSNTSNSTPTSKRFSNFLIKNLTDQNLPIATKYKIAMLALDNQVSHGYGVIRCMLSLLGKIPEKDEMRLLNKIFTIQERDEMLEELLTDLEKFPRFSSAKLTRLFNDKKVPSINVPAEKLFPVIADLSNLPSREIHATLEALCLQPA